MNSSVLNESDAATNVTVENDEMDLRLFLSYYHTAVLSCLYTITLPTYVAVMLAFVKYKFYKKSSFYVCCLTVGVADVLFMVNNLLVFVIPGASLMLFGRLPSVYPHSRVPLVACAFLPLT